MSETSLTLVTINAKNEPYIKATELGRQLGFKEPNQVSKIVRRREEDFTNDEFFISPEGIMYLNYDGAVKVCMFATTPRSREVREEITEVYKAWRSGDVYSNKEVSKVEQALYMAKAVMKLAEAQYDLEKKQEQQGERIEVIEEKIKDINQKLNPKEFITEEQASQISVLVRMLGQALSEKHQKNKFAAVYAELYRRFSVTTYKNIPQDQFLIVMRWLQDWNSSVTN